MKFVSRVRWKGQAALFRLSAWQWRDQLPSEPDIDVEVEVHGEGSASYAVVPHEIDGSSVVYSIGIGSEVSFDTSMIRAYGLDVYAFDPTEASARFVTGATLPDRFHFIQGAVSDRDGPIGFSELKPGNERYLAGTVLNVPGSTDEVQGIRLSTAMRELGHDRIDVLKLDIEGGEYAVLDDLRREPVNIRQIVLEFHPHIANLEDHGSMLGKEGWERTRVEIDGLRDLGFEIVHVSARGTEFSFLRT